MIEAALDSVSPAAQAKAIEIARDVDDIEPITGDYDRLQQVVWNLLSNAVKFTPREGRVTVSLKRVERRRGAARRGYRHRHSRRLPALRLRPLPPGRRHRDPQARRPRARHGHRPAISSSCTAGRSGPTAPARGRARRSPSRCRHVSRSTPTTSSRTRPGEAAGRRRRSATLPQPRRRHGAGRGRRQDSRSFMCQLLENHGASVAMRTRPPRRSLRFEQLRPDVLISDIGMPDEDGYALIRRVRSLGSHEGGNTPAVALTAYVRPKGRGRRAFRRLSPPHAQARRRLGADYRRCRARCQYADDGRLML